MAFPGVCRTATVRGRGLCCRTGHFPGDGEGLSEDDEGDVDDDDHDGNEDYG